MTLTFDQKKFRDEAQNVISQVKTGKLSEAFARVVANTEQFHTFDPMLPAKLKQQAQQFKAARAPRQLECQKEAFAQLLARAASVDYFDIFKQLLTQQNPIPAKPSPKQMEPPSEIHQRLREKYRSPILKEAVLRPKSNAKQTPQPKIQEKQKLEKHQNETRTKTNIYKSASQTEPNQVKTASQKLIEPESSGECRSQQRKPQPKPSPPPVTRPSTDFSQQKILEDWDTAMTEAMKQTQHEEPKPATMAETCGFVVEPLQKKDLVPKHWSDVPKELRAQHQESRRILRANCEFYENVRLAHLSVVRTQCLDETTRVYNAKTEILRQMQELNDKANQLRSIIRMEVNILKLK